MSLFELYVKLGKVLPDSLYLRIYYLKTFHKRLNLSNPVTFSEKIQWLKLYDRNPLYITLVDKYTVKEYVANKIGKQYIISTLGVWEHFDDIDFDSLPNQFVLKCTHDSGGLVIVKDKTKIDLKSAKEKLESSLKTNYYWAGREWPYKDVKPRIIAEQYMEDSTTHDLPDYKFFAFDGVVRSMYIATDRQNSNTDTKFDFFDANFEHLNFTNGHPNANVLPNKPECFEEMKSLAEKLSKGIPQLRCDFYEINGKVYFGELTFFHLSGFVPFNPPEWDERFGSWIKLPCRQKKASKRQ